MSAHCDFVWVQIGIHRKRMQGTQQIQKPENWRLPWNVDAVLQAVHQKMPRMLGHCDSVELYAFAPGTTAPQHAGKNGALAGDVLVTDIKTKTDEGEESLEISFKNPLFVVAPAMPKAAETTRGSEDEKNGSYYATVQDIWKPEEKKFKGGLEGIRRQTPRSPYRPVLEQIGAIEPKQQSEDESSVRKSDTLSNKTGNSVSGEKKDLFGYTNAEDAHQVPDSDICAPSYGIIAQAIMATDIEALPLEKLRTMRARIKNGKAGNETETDGETKELVRELLTFIVSASKYSLKDVAVNKIRVSPGHQRPYDVNPEYMTLPLMSLEDAKDWHPRKGYWVAIVCNSPKAYDLIVGIRSSAPEEGYRVDDADQKEIEDATELLASVVKAHAEVVNGTRGDKNSIVSPLDFITDRGEETKMNELRSILSKGLVHVPGKPCKGENVLKVYVASNYDYEVPDPLLVAMKAAINWYFMVFQRKLLPACQKPMDPEKALIEQMNEEYYEECMQKELRPGTWEELARGLGQWPVATLDYSL